MPTTDTARHKQPSKIAGTPVHAISDELIVKGQPWVTLMPTDEDDDRVWEWCPATGEILEMDL